MSHNRKVSAPSYIWTGVTEETLKDLFSSYWTVKFYLNTFLFHPPFLQKTNPSGWARLKMQSNSHGGACGRQKGCKNEQNLEDVPAGWSGNSREWRQPQQLLGRGMKPRKVWMTPGEQLLFDRCQCEPGALSRTWSHVEHSCPALPGETDTPGSAQREEWLWHCCCSTPSFSSTGEHIWDSLGTTTRHLSTLTGKKRRKLWLASN